MFFKKSYLQYLLFDDRIPKIISSIWCELPIRNEVHANCFYSSHIDKNLYKAENTCINQTISCQNGCWEKKVFCMHA